MSLAELSLRTSYHKGESDIAGDFYIPCMLRAINYSKSCGILPKLDLRARLASPS